MEIRTEHANFLLTKIRSGDVVLVLGAGAARGAKNRQKKPLLMGSELASVLAEQMGASYDGESLAEVVSAFESMAGTPSLHALLQREFRHTTPGDDLARLFRYSWRRLYTFNYDDSLSSASQGGVQKITAYNGMGDKVEDLPALEHLQLVYLHGEVSKLDKGIILSEQDYSRALQQGAHAWYRKAVEDYRGYCPLFIGSMLNEPILHAELYRAAREDTGVSGLAFVVTPDEISAIRRQALLSKGIVHVKGTLEELLNWVEENVGAELDPAKIVGQQSLFPTETLERFSFEDISAAQSLRAIDRAALIRNLNDLPSPAVARLAERYLIGFPPDWTIAASDIPVRLSNSEPLKKALESAVREKDPFFVVTGQAGSGKTTAVLQALLDISSASNGGIELYELSPETQSVSRALNVLQRMNTKRKLVYIPNLFVFGGRLAQDLQTARDAGVTIVATARSSEWGEHLARYFGECPSFQFQRFDRRDFEPLIDRLTRYVPAPAFRKMSRRQQLEKLQKSKSQLLIALREVTASGNFDQIIFDEYEKLPDQDVRDLFVIVGAATLARVGIRKEVAAEAYLSARRSRSFESALAAMEGIVAEGPSGRLLARHEFYVRKVFDQRTDSGQLTQGITSIIDTFLKYEIPVMHHVSRTDGALLRYVLNHRVLREQGEAHHDRQFGIGIYERYTVPLQLEGHFWLQYGLYEANLGETDAAAEKLQKSFEAHPDNPYTMHALGSLKLKQARVRSAFDSTTRKLLNEAVTILERMAAKPYYQFDHYPLVTLAKQHISTLWRHGRTDDAKKYGTDYYNRLRELNRQVTTAEVPEAMGLLLKFLTSGEWPSSAPDVRLG